MADRIAIIRHGRIVALGTPAELKMRLLGPPTMELHLAHSLNGAARLISDLVQIEAHGENWLRYSTPNPHEINPILLQDLTARGVEIVTVSEVERTLEDVYLQVVNEQETGPLSQSPASAEVDRGETDSASYI